jgi:hypothetical protein
MNPDKPRTLPAYLLIALLAALAVSQPLFDLLGRQAEFLVAHGMGAFELGQFALLLGLALPLVLALLQRLTGVAGYYVIGITLGALAALPLTISMGLTGIAAILTAAVTGGAIVAAHRRWAVARMFVTYLSPAVLLFPLMFLFFSRATPLLHAESEADTTIRLATTPDIVFLVLDEFPLVSLLDENLEIDRHRYPNFARLADRANWYAGATTGAVVTVNAVPEALTGTTSDPAAEKLPIAAHFPRNLFTLLQDHYRMNVMETATRLCPRRLCLEPSSRGAETEVAGSLLDDLLLVYRHLVTPSPWAEQLPSISDGWSGFNRERAAADDPDLEEAMGIADLARQMTWNSRSAHVRHFIEQVTSTDQPGLNYLHALLPHRVWRFLPDGRQYLVDEVWAALDPPHSRPTVADGQIFGHRWQPDPLAVHMAQQRHILQLGFTDRLLGELLDHLESIGLLDSSLLVIAGDHGASFIPGQPRRVITSESLSDISAIPLFIKLPGQSRGRRFDTPAGLIDILPSVAEALGADIDWAFDGVSLLGDGVEDQQRSTVTVKNSSGAEISYPFEQHMAHLAERARANAAVFGSGDDPALWLLGPSPELVGMEHKVLPRETASDLRLELDAPDLYDAVDPAASYVPLHLSGTIGNLAGQEGSLNLAISVNGVVRATTRTYRIEGYEDQFAALLPPDALREGANEIRVFVIREQAGATALQEIPSPQRPVYRRMSDNTGEWLEDPLGKRLAVEPGPDRGNALTVEVEGAALLNLHGYVAEGSTVNHVVAFIDDRFAGSAEPVDGVYTLPLAPASDASVRGMQLRVFGVTAGQAYELEYPEPCADLWHFAAPPGWLGISCVTEATNPLQADNGRYFARLEFADAAIKPYLGAGWSYRHGDISWTNSQQADLIFPIDGGFAAIRVTALAQPFLAPPQLQHQDVYLLANHEKIATWRLDEARFTPLEANIPGALLKGRDELVLSFLVPNAASPYALGTGADVRVLGLAFMSIELEAGARPVIPGNE